MFETLSDYVDALQRALPPDHRPPQATEGGGGGAGDSMLMENEAGQRGECKRQSMEGQGQKSEGKTQRISEDAQRNGRGQSENQIALKCCKMFVRTETPMPQAPFYMPVGPRRAIFQTNISDLTLSGLPFFGGGGGRGSAGIFF